MELRLISLCFYDLQVRDLSIHKITRRFAPEKINKIELYFCIQRMFETICEIKFKYVWRCFIKSRIDFCEILLSLPSRKCGLKSTFTIVGIVIVAPTDRSQSDCVHGQVAKADCKCPFY